MENIENGMTAECPETILCDDGQTIYLSKGDKFKIENVGVANGITCFQIKSEEIYMFCKSKNCHHLRGLNWIIS